MAKSLYTPVLYTTTIVAIIAYNLLTFNTKVTNNVYKLTDQQLFNLRLSIVLPVVFIWLLGTYGVAKLKSYSASIKKDPDGRGFNTLANGLMVLIYGSIASSLVTTTYSYLKPQLEATANRTALSTYLQLAVALVGYLFILRGATKLVRVVKAGEKFRKGMVVALVGMCVLAAGLLYLALSHLPATALTTRTRPYYLTTALAVSTVILPYIISWTMGAVGFVAIQTYANNVKGSLYKKALLSLRLGLAVVVSFSISLQILTNMGFAFEKWSLKAILILIYVILGIYALGYIFIARGARKLSKIESAATGGGIS